VYVRPFPTGEGEYRLSVEGGEQARWRGDGTEVFFVGADSKMMAIAVKPEDGSKPSFNRGTPTPLFDSHIAQNPATSAFQYDVTPDGKRFLINTSLLSTSVSSAAPLTVVVNWNAVAGN
jgi:hypothetical protein